MRDPPTGTVAAALVMILVGSVVLSGAALGGVPGAAEATLQEDAQDEGPDTQQTSYLRVVHASADAPAVDVAVDGETVVSGLELGETSDYLALRRSPPAGR
ncbi:hypothetical protein BRC97_12835 [Halobacteriales archaeon QS_6_71_20]|nr:MAG: hypothetical protein BRC97_12835 [Halobacteriales archaeon QS_6_71_20]